MRIKISNHINLKNMAFGNKISLYCYLEILFIINFVVVICFFFVLGCISTINKASSPWSCICDCLSCLYNWVGAGLTWLWGWKEKKGINHKFPTNFNASTDRIIGYINALKWMVFSYVVLQCSVINQSILGFNIKMNKWMVTPT